MIPQSRTEMERTRQNNALTKGDDTMKRNHCYNEVNWPIAADSELATRFAVICEANGTSPEEVLSAFIKDYIVSGGHPETVIGKWPWNRNT